MEAYNLDTLKLLDRVGAARSNILAAYHNADNPTGSMQHRKRDLGKIASRYEMRDVRRHKIYAGLITIPEQYEDNKNFRYCAYIYALDKLGKQQLKDIGITPSDKLDLKNPWHTLMVSDIVLSLAIECKERGIPFRFQQDIIAAHPLTFPTNIYYDFIRKGTLTYKEALEPDYLFSIGDKYFLLEADRHTETIRPSDFHTKSHLRSILQYRHILKNKTYTDLIPSVFVLTITTSEEHSNNIREFMLEDLAMSSKAMLFTGLPVLGLKEKYPQPLKLLDLKFDRVDHSPTTIMEIVNGSTSKADEPLRAARWPQ